jgi:hypothetical protein
LTKHGSVRFDPAHDVKLGDVVEVSADASLHANNGIMQ